MDNPRVVCHDIHGQAFEVPVNDLIWRPSIYGVIIKEEKVLLSKQWDGYDFPGGGIDIGESLEHALAREIKEETGYETIIGQVIHVQSDFYKIHEKEKYVQSILIYYTAEIISGEASTKFLDEHEKTYTAMPEWIPVKKISELKFYNPVNNNALVQKASKLSNPLESLS